MSFSSALVPTVRRSRWCAAVVSGLGVAIALAVSLATALTIGPLLLRLRGHYFAIATVGLNEMVKALASNLAPLTGGGMGLSLPLPHGTPSQKSRGSSTIAFWHS